MANYTGVNIRTDQVPVYWAAAHALQREYYSSIERFDADFARLLDELGAPLSADELETPAWAPLRRDVRAKRYDDSGSQLERLIQPATISPAAASAVRRYYAQDFECLGYDWEHVGRPEWHARASGAAGDSDRGRAGV